jgi:hypothetical protein
LEQIAARPASVLAVWHPLELMHVEIGREGDTSLRLHIWGSTPARFDSSGHEVHCHEWDLKSYVICGGLRHFVYRVERGPATHAVYRVEYRGFVNELRHSGREIRCAAPDVRVLEAGQTYQLPAGIYHRVVGSMITTATLVEARYRRDRSNRVLGSLAGAPSYVTRRWRCPPSLVRKAALDVLDSCSSAVQREAIQEERDRDPRLELCFASPPE